jgi:hypothetical protein
MKEWLLVLKAADAAARWHVHQRRKGPAEEPYINHGPILLSVCSHRKRASIATKVEAEASSGADGAKIARDRLILLAATFAFVIFSRHSDGWAAQPELIV